MSKKDYIALAKVIHTLPTRGFSHGEAYTFAQILADEFLKPDNSKFDRDKFLSACEV